MFVVRCVGAVSLELGYNHDPFSFVTIKLVASLIGVIDYVYAHMSCVILSLSLPTYLPTSSSRYSSSWL